ncbi:MAG: argininosuccinate lyase [Arenimonas sp.]|nr:argininosuccinate lyase [Arenimonas sp.]MBP7916979.1 argininosuccinate lyase [Arenimonas sp.]
MSQHLLWGKPGSEINQAIQDFLAGGDIILDRELFLYDIHASLAHAQGLQHIGIVSTAENLQLQHALEELAELFRQGQFMLDGRFEDGQSAIEHFLIERLGELGKKIHTGRSRNDQVLVASRLWLKHQLETLVDQCKTIASVALRRAQAEALLPLPGYTHMQRAMVSSCGMWWGAWAEGFIDNALRAAQTVALIDANPLGSASGFGVNLALDRKGSTERLGFGRTQQIATYAQLSRGKYEIAALDALLSAMGDLRRLAWDLSLFTSSEFGFVQLPAEYQTGSSLMPNKRNPDLVELLRASYATVSGARSELEQLLSLPSGYHRDLQYTKAPSLRGFAHGLAALALLPDLLDRLQWNVPAIQGALEPSMHATDLAIEFAQQGLPFRDAYRKAADPALWEDRDASESLAARVSEGSGVNLGLEILKARLTDIP